MGLNLTRDIYFKMLNHSVVLVAGVFIFTPNFIRGNTRLTTLWLYPCHLFTNHPDPEGIKLE